MTSSILHFKQSAPRVLKNLALVGITAWALAAAYCLWGDPEIRDFRIGARIKRAYSHELSREFTNKFIVCGGSSSSFSLDGAYARELGVPIANLSLGAGMGLQVLTRFAVLEAKPGDTLVMMIEPALLNGTLEIPDLGQQFAIAMGLPELASEDFSIIPERHFSPGLYLRALRPGGMHTIILLGKVTTGSPLFRYKVGEWKPSGQKFTQVRIPPVFPGSGGRVSEAARQFLSHLKIYCDRNQIKLLYALPWAYCPSTEERTFRAENLITLKDLAATMPILADSRLGAYSESRHFADTAWHLNEEGARVRTKELVDALRAGHTWSIDDLGKMALESPPGLFKSQHRSGSSRKRLR